MFRRGYSLLEVLSVVALIAIALATCLPPLPAGHDTDFADAPETVRYFRLTFAKPVAAELIAKEAEIVAASGAEGKQVADVRIDPAGSHVVVVGCWLSETADPSVLAARLYGLTSSPTHVVHIDEPDTI